MNNNNNYKIYKIHSHLGNKIYVGKTQDTVINRMKQHISQYNLYVRLFGGTQFTSSYILFDEYGVDNCAIEEITEVLCNKKIACIVEGAHILFFKQNINFEIVNHNIAGRTRQEYRIENIEKINGKHNCECCGKFTYNGKGLHIKTKRHQKYLLNLFQQPLL